MSVTALWVILGLAALAVLGAVMAGMLLGPAPPGPAVLRYFQPSFLERAAAYERVNLSVFLLRHLVSFAFLAVLAAAALHRLPAGFRPGLAAAAGWILLILLLYHLLNLPLDFYRGYVVEQRFGFSTHTAGGWFLDYGKSLLIGLVVATGGLTGLYWIMLRRPGDWWLIAGAVFALYLVAHSYLSPLIIDPLFYRFTPLEKEPLRSGILNLAGEAGLAVEEVLVADAGRRTRKVNAYFTGLGRTKRIVVYDTLLARFPDEQVLAVIAHEMGHWRGRHILKGIACSALGGFLALYLVRLLLQGMGKTGFQALPAALLALALLSLAAAPLGNAISRAFEREADRAALDWMKNPAAFVELERNLALANLATVKPHPLIRVLLYTHPPVMERIEVALGER